MDGRVLFHVEKHTIFYGWTIRSVWRSMMFVICSFHEVHEMNTYIAGYFSLSKSILSLPSAPDWIVCKCGATDFESETFLLGLQII
jgi:hypothetical protein